MVGVSQFAEGRFHRAGEDTVQYLSLHPLGPAAEMLRVGVVKPGFARKRPPVIGPRKPVSRKANHRAVNTTIDLIGVALVRPARAP